MQKRYVARRDRLKVGDGDQVGEIHGGEAFPARDVTHSLLNVGWVGEGRGTVPVDDATHGAFADGELDDHAPADPAAVKAFKQARKEAEAIAAGEPIETAPAAKKAPAKKRKAPAAKKGAAKKRKAPAAKKGAKH